MDKPEYRCPLEAKKGDLYDILMKADKAFISGGGEPGDFLSIHVPDDYEEKGWWRAFIFEQIPGRTEIEVCKVPEYQEKVADELFEKVEERIFIKK